MHKLLLPFILATAGVLLASSPALAYIGPGAAVAAIGYIFGPVVAILVTVGLVLLWPMRILWKKWKLSRAAKASNAETDGPG